MNLDKLRIFYYAAMAKSFTNCGLHLSPSAISRHITDLEYSLKTKLFKRSPKGLTLTPHAEELLKTCHQIFQELEGLEERFMPNTKEPEGLLRLTTPGGWISNIVVTMIKDFLKANPKIRMSIRSMDHVPDFSRSETDIALLPFDPDEPELKAVALIELQLGLYASPSYIEEYGAPQTIADLKDHRLISYGEHEHPLVNINWHLELGVEPGGQHEPYLMVNNLYYAAEAGLGIVTLAEQNILLRQEKLKRILPTVMGPTMIAYGVFPKRFEKTRRVASFIDYFKQKVEEQVKDRDLDH